MKFSEVYAYSERNLRGFTVPLQPKVVSELLAVFPNMETMTEIVKKDACLTASAIKMVYPKERKNSQVERNVEAALSELGVDGIMAMVNAQLMRKANIFNSEQTGLTEFWQINQDVSNACNLIARQLNLQLIEPIYYLGLFHNIGIPLISQKHPSYFNDLRNQKSLSTSDFEYANYNCSHSIVGYFIARSMHLDTSLCEAIRLHHDIEAILNIADMEQAIALPLAVLKLAEHIIDESAILYHTEGDEEWVKIGGAVLDYLTLSDNEFHSIFEIIADELELR